LSALFGFAVIVPAGPIGDAANVNGIATANEPNPVPIALIAETRKVVFVPLTRPANPAFAEHAVMDVQVKFAKAPETNGVSAVVVPRTVNVPFVAQFALHISTL
jgi:hypothetical protein